MTESDNKILEDFRNRRALFDKHIEDKGLELFACPGCGYPTLMERGEYQICDVCNWEDDYSDENEADQLQGGPNKLSLTENRINIGKVLNDNADLSGGKINLDPEYVLQAIRLSNDKKVEIQSRMTGDEILNILFGLNGDKLKRICK